MKTLGAKFYNKEALSNREAQDLFDPSQIRIYLVDEFESNLARPQAIRLSQGRYITRVDEEILIPTKVYELIWVYDLHPGCPQVLRQSFVYNDAPPILTGMCRIYGTVESNGFPIAGVSVFFDLIKDKYSVQFSQSQDSTVSDAFGEWSVYLTQGKNGHIVIPVINDRKLFVVPAENSKNYDDLVALQTVSITDSFGNPV